jgi:predicted ABC-type ATPase
MKQPLLVIVGGPNGSGKSSQCRPYLEEGLFFLNPDEIARALNPKDVHASAIEAGRVVLNYSAQLVKERRSFALESTLSGRRPLKLLATARAAGYRTKLVYIGTVDPSVNIDRVATRVARGGHHIPTEDIIRRWHRSVAGMQRYLKAVEAAWGSITVERGRAWWLKPRMGLPQWFIRRCHIGQNRPLIGYNASI